MGGARKGIGWCLGLGDACQEIRWYLRDAGEVSPVIAALFFVLSGSFGCSFWISSVHQLSQISNVCLMFATFLVPSGQLLLLSEGPTADYGIQGFSMPDRVLP